MIERSIDHEVSDKVGMKRRCLRLSFLEGGPLSFLFPLFRTSDGQMSLSTFSILFSRSCEPHGNMAPKWLIL